MHHHDHTNESCCGGESQCGCHHEEKEMQVSAHEGCGCQSEEKVEHSCGCSH